MPERKGGPVRAYCFQNRFGWGRGGHLLQFNPATIPPFKPQAPYNPSMPRTRLFAAATILAVWIALGYYMLIFLAGLQAVPTELYDAAHIDGANAFARFWVIHRSVGLAYKKISVTGEKIVVVEVQRDRLLVALHDDRYVVARLVSEDGFGRGHLLGWGRRIGYRSGFSMGCGGVV